MPTSDFQVIGSTEEIDAARAVLAAWGWVRSNRFPLTPEYIIAKMRRDGTDALIPFYNPRDSPRMTGLCEAYGECRVSGWRCNVTEVTSGATRSEAIQAARDLLGSSGLCGSVRRQDRRNTRTAQRITRRTQRSDFRQDERQETRGARLEQRIDREELREMRSERGAGFSGFVGSIGDAVGSILGSGPGPLGGPVVGGIPVVPVLAAGGLAIGGYFLLKAK